MKKFPIIIIIFFILTDINAQKNVPHKLILYESAITTIGNITKNGYADLGWSDDKGTFLNEEKDFKLKLEDTEYLFYIETWNIDNRVSYGKCANNKGVVFDVFFTKPPDEKIDMFYLSFVDKNKIAFCYKLKRK